MALTRRRLLAGLVVGSAAVLSGCGFRLRGTGALAGARYQSVFLRGESGVPAELANSLRQQLRGLGVVVTEAFADAEVVIELGRYNRQLSRTSRSATGEATSELIRLTQSFRAERIADEQEIIAADVIAMRDRQIDPNQLLAAARELEDIERQMQQDLARQLIDRINRSYARLPETNLVPANATPQAAPRLPTEDTP